MNTIKPDQIIELEPSLIKVPYEQLRKSFRYQYKYIEKELALLYEKIEKSVKDTNLSPEKATLVIDDLIKQVEKLTRKLEKIKEEELGHTRRIKKRIDNLSEIETVSSAQSPEFIQWSKTRLERVIVDYLLREGMPNTAKKIAKENDIEDIVDIELFERSEKIEQALRNQSCKECLSWCSENRSNLKKLKSTLEFNLRIQEFIELIRVNKRIEAIEYSQKYFGSWKDTEIKKIGEVMTLLAFQSNTNCHPYNELYSKNRWQQLINQFRSENYSLCSLTSHPLLSITLQAGLSALKTLECYEHDNKNINCPICDNETLGELAKNLPLSHHVNSTIVCRISGKIMNEDNPPMLLPNGRVYSYEALKLMSEKNNGKIICPRTGDITKMDELKKVFIS